MSARFGYKGCSLLRFDRWVFEEESFEGMVSSLEAAGLVAGFPGWYPGVFWQKTGFGASALYGTAQRCMLPSSEGPVSLASYYFAAQPGSGPKEHQ